MWCFSLRLIFKDITLFLRMINSFCVIHLIDVPILARLNVAGKILHRQCFRCARCQAQLSIANYYETESEGTYCCEMCPDEEQIRETEVALTKMTLERNQKLVGSNSDRDEEGSSSENDDEKEATSRKSGLEPSGQKLDIEDKNSLPESQQNTDEKLVVTVSTDDPDGSASTNATIHIETISQQESIIEDSIETESLENKEDKVSIPDESMEINPENLEKQNENTNKNDNDAPTLRPECDQLEAKEQEQNKESNPFEEDADVEDNNEDNTLITDELKEQQDNPVSDTEISGCQKEVILQDKNEANSRVIDNDQNEEEASVIVDKQSVAASDEKMSSSEASIDQKNKENSQRKDEINYPSDMNPFGDDDEDEEEETSIDIKEESIEPETKPHAQSVNETKKESTNPFGSDFEESEEEDAVGELKNVSNSGAALDGPPKPPRAPPVRQSLNPFGSDFEDDDDEESKKSNNAVIVSSDPRYSHSYSNVTLRSPPSPALSTSSRISSLSANKRKKRPAPPPPPSNNGTKPSPTVRTAVSPIPSPRTSVRPKDSSPTPAPRASKLFNSTSPVGSTHKPPPRPPPPTSFSTPGGELPKSRKDKDNLNRRSQCLMQMSQAAAESNIGSAGTSDVDSSSIMSGSITSNR